MTFYKTLFARMGNIKAGKYVSDDGEDLNDTEKVLKKNGILLRNSTNEFRNFGDVLDEVAGKWESYDNVTQHAIATAFAGTRQQEKFFVLMENYGKALEYEAVAAESAGTANQKYTDAYLNSIEARKNAMKAAFESLSQTVLDSGLVKVFYTVLTGIITAIDKLISSGAGAVIVIELLWITFRKLGKAAVEGTGIFALFNKTLLNSTGLTLAESVANIGLWGTIKAVTKALWEQVAAWIAAGGWIPLVAAAVAGLIILFAKLAQAPAKARQKSAEALQEIRREISETSSELETLESNLEDIKKRIAEIKSNPLKNIADMNELERLERQLSILEDRLSRAEEKNRRLREQEQKQFLENTVFSSDYNDINVTTKEKYLSTKSRNSTNRFLLGTMLNLVQSGQDTPESLKESYKFYDQIASWIDDLNEDLGDLTYISYPANETEEAVNERIRTIYAIFDTWDALFNSDGLFERILNRPYNAGVKSLLESIASPDDLQVLYNANPEVKKFIDNIVRLFGLNLEDGGFTYIFNSLRTVPVAAENATKSIVALYDALTGEDLKDATKAVSTLAEAIEEMDGSGKISLETAEKLAELGEEYVDAISIENGEIRVNTSLLRGMAIEKYELAKATAISNGATEQTIALYDMLIQKTKELGSGDALTRANSLLDYENTILEFAGGADYDQRRLINTSRQRDNVLKQIGYLRDHGYSSDSEEIMSLYKQYIEYTERMISLNKEFASQEEDDIKSAIESENEELEEQKNLLDDIIDARKKALDLAKDENHYQKELAEKQKKVGDLQTQLAAARLDTSASGRARVRQLEEQLANAQSDLDDFNLEHATDIISDRLDAEKAENEALYEKEKADNDARLDQLLADNKANLEQYSTNLKEEIDIVGDALGDIDLDINDPEKGVANTLTDIEEVIQRIELKIGKDNEEYPDVLPPVDYNGPLSIDDITEAKINRSRGFKYRKYHSGGIVDDLGLGDNEVFAKLMKGEYVATPTQMSRFLKSTLPNMVGAGGQQFNAPLIAVNCESLNEESLPKLETIIKSAADRIKAELTSAFDKTGFRSPNKRILAY